MECRGNQSAMRTVVVRALSFSVVAALTLSPALPPVVAAESTAMLAACGQSRVRFLALGVGAGGRGTARIRRLEIPGRRTGA